MKVLPLLKNIKQAELQIEDHGADPRKGHFIVDCDASSKRMHWMEGISPCITKARNKGHFVTSENGRFSIEDMFRLHRMDPTNSKLL